MAANGVPALQKAKSNIKASELAHKPVSSGPWGSDGGLSWDDGVHTGIRQIVLRYGYAIDSITIEYDDEGASWWSHRHGGSGGAHTQKIVIDHPREYLVGISGHYGSFYFKGPPAVRSLTFHTNLGKHGPFGVQQGQSFESSTLGSRIIGFHGRSGNVVDAMGVYTQLYVKCCDQQHGCEASMMLPTIISSVKDIVDALKVPSTAPKSLLTREVSHGTNWKPLPSLTWGGEGGNPWDDGIYSGIRQIVIKYGDVVDSVTVEYARNGQFIWGVKHGGLGGNKVQTVKLNYPEEYLVSVSGYYGPMAPHNSIAVKSLTFHTNKGRYGPFGSETGTFFSSPESGGKILGLCGRSGWYMDAIGVHLVAEETVDTPLNKEEVENAWKEFVSRVVHQKVLAETKAGI